MTPQTPVNLDNCAKEPIHIPGLVQPHGAMLVFDQAGILVAKSENASSMLDCEISLGQKTDCESWTPELREAVSKSFSNPGVNVEPVETMIGVKHFEFYSHQSDDKIIVEIEPRTMDITTLMTFAANSQIAIARLQAATSIQELVETAVLEIRRLTGFDRVMAYQFRHDYSGDIIAEERRDDLEPFLGLRYPASDIPAQARRLYTINTLRFIVDVDAQPVPLDPPSGPDSGKPLDMSHSLLRSVSPIHIEYLKNMGVRASMSISVVRQGRLTKLFACHHYSSAKLVPQAIRQTCKLIGQVVSLLADQHRERERVIAIDMARSQIESILTVARYSEDVFGIVSKNNEVSELIPSCGVAISYGGQIISKGATLTKPNLETLFASLGDPATHDIVKSNQLKKDYPNLDIQSDVAGFLAISFHPEENGWLMWFRPEERETIRWAGNPDKVYDVGPNGPRLTPRGSFEEYQVQAKDQSAPWQDIELDVAERLRNGLQMACLGRSSELDRARRLLMASITHDLRNPLSAISLSAELLSNQIGDQDDLASLISQSTVRMARLIDQLMDYSRLQSESKIGIVRRPTPLKKIVDELILETEAAYPGIEIVKDIDSIQGQAYVDPSRFQQIISNLLSNARHHGDLNAPIGLHVSGGNSEPIRIRVSNKGKEIPEEVRGSLFTPFKHIRNKARNRSGLGLGLYIVYNIVMEHEGEIELLPYDGQHVTFHVQIPPIDPDILDE